MANKECIERLKLTIERLYKCGAHHLRTEQVHEKVGDSTVWKSAIEVFGLVGNTRAKRCYGWTYGEPEQVITILELPPFDSAESAIKASISFHIKRPAMEFQRPATALVDRSGFVGST